MKQIAFILLMFMTTLGVKAQTIKYIPAMKSYVGEWKCEQGDVEMILVIEKVGTNIRVKYKAVNYENGRPRTYYTDYQKVTWANGKFTFSYITEEGLTIKDVASLKNNVLTLMYYCYKGNVLKSKSEIGKFHNW